MADKEKPPEVKKLPQKPPLPPRRAATANAIDKKDLEKAAVLSKTSTSTSFGINGGDEDVKTDNTNLVQTLEKPPNPKETSKVKGFSVQISEGFFFQKDMLDQKSNLILVLTISHFCNHKEANEA